MTDSLIAHLAAPGVRRLVPYQPGKPISELQRELGLTAIIKLASNENPLGPSPRALAVIAEHLPRLAEYPDGSGYALKHALARHLAVEPQQITLGNGSNDVLELIARAFLTPDSEAIYAQHAFAVYPLVTCAIGATGRETPVTASFDYDLDAMLRAINARTRVVFLANPNNPTGTYLTAETLRRFLEALPAYVIAVIDEAYLEYASDSEIAPGYASCLPWLADFPNLVVVRTFSKAYGLAGLRIGYAASSPLIADLLNRVRQPFNNNSLALACAEAALDDPAHIAQSVAVNRAGMAQLQTACVTRGWKGLPSAGNFVLLDLQQPAQPIYEKLLQRGVIVRPVANYGLPQHLRVTIGTPEQNQRFIDALDECLRDVR